MLCTAFAAAVATLGFTTAFTPTTILHATARSAVTLRRRTSSLIGDDLLSLEESIIGGNSDADGSSLSSVREIIPVNSIKTTAVHSSRRELLFVKVFGERHSGTNFLENTVLKPRRSRGPQVHASICQECSRKWKMGPQVVLPGVENAQDADSYFNRTLWQNLGWKHQRVPAPELLQKPQSPGCQDTLFVVTTRHPLDWVQSLYRQTYILGWNPVTAGISLEQFMQAPAVCTPRGLPRGDGVVHVPSGGCSQAWAYNYCTDEICRSECYANPIRMWMEKVESYARLAEAGCAVIATRFAEYTIAPKEVSCALVFATPADSRAQLWDADEVRRCQLLPGSGAAVTHRLEGGGTLVVGPGHAERVAESRSQMAARRRSKHSDGDCRKLKWRTENVCKQTWDESMQKVCLEHKGVASSTRRWLAEQLSDLSPTARLMTNYEYD